MRLAVSATLVLWLTAAFAGADPPPPGSAKLILPPRYFPGWQSQNVCFPCVIQESDGSYRMFYTGSASEQWSDSHWEQWVTGYVASRHDHLEVPRELRAGVVRSPTDGGGSPRSRGYGRGL
jgi:hypothetical protein